MKKTMILVIAFVLSLFILPSALAAEGETFSYEIPGTTMSLRYKIMEDDTIEIVRSPDVAGELVIPAEIDGKAVTSIGNGAFSGCAGLTDIDIPNLVTSIGVNAFRGCSGLTTITIPDSVQSIDVWAFEECSGLTDITIGRSVATIEWTAFFNCPNINAVTVRSNDLRRFSVDPECAVNVVFSDTVTTVNDWAFSSCKNVMSVTFSGSVTTIGKAAFWGCTSLEAIVFPDSITTIGESAFGGCTGLTEIMIPDSVTSIGSYAFEGCSGLAEARYSSSLPIDSLVFNDCDNLARVYCDGRLLPNLAVPSDLSWNAEDTPGFYTYKINEPTQDFYSCHLYRVGDENRRQFDSIFWTESEDRGRIELIDSDNMESGDYYFTVQNIGDGKNYWNSEVATSDIWTYIKPQEKIDSVAETSLTWDENSHKLTWTGLPDDDAVWGYRIWRRSFATENFEDATSWRSEGRIIMKDDGFVETDSSRVSGKTYFWDFNDDWEYFVAQALPEKYKYYCFTVQTISNDVEHYQNSEIVLTSVFYLQDTIADVNDTLSEISEDADIREEVQKIGTTDLTMALLADKNEDGGTADILRQLEEKTGVTVAVDTAEGFEAFTGTSIIGAALNDVPEGTDTITLNIDAPEKEHVIPTQYKNTVALRFSMGLDGVTAPEDLKVPVKVTLPVPATINPDFLILLHYGQDGKAEVVYPNTFKKDGKWYASIVLTHFSDFVMTETAQKEEGNKPSGDGGGSSSGGSTGTSVPSGGGTPADTTPSEDIPPIDEPPAFVLEEVFDDIAKTAWYYDAVEFVAEKGLMNGVGNKQFAPDEYITRASIAQILYNSEENRDITISNPFDDVIRGSWYEDAVVWAAEQGIVTGFNANTFGPDGLITREQFAVMLWRHAGKPTSNISLDEFTDCDTAGEYAIPALKWAVESEIIKGAGEGILAPLRNATRAETAQMLMRYFQ